MDTVSGSQERDATARELLQALVKEGIPEVDAHKVVQVVLAHVAENHDKARVKVTGGPTLRKFWMSTVATVVAGLLGGLATVPLIEQLHASGFPGAAFLVLLALGMIGVLAGFRLRSLRESAKKAEVKIEIVGIKAARDQGEPSTELARPDFATFANAVGRVADRDTYAVG